MKKLNPSEKEKVLPQKGVTPPNEIVSLKKEVTPLNETISSEKEATPANETISLEKEATPPNEIVSLKKEVTPLNEIISSEKEATPANETISFKKKVTPPNEIVLLKEGEKSLLEKSESIVKIAAFILAGVWAIYTFYYQYQTLPSLEPTECSVKLDFKFLKSDSSVLYYLFTVRIKNESKIAERIVASPFNICGIKTKKMDFYKPGINPTNNNLTDEYFNQYYFAASRVYFAGGRALADTTLIQPNQEFDSDRIIAVPQQLYDQINIDQVIFQAKPEQLLNPIWRRNEQNYLFVELYGKKGIVTVNSHSDVLSYRHIKLYIPQSNQDKMN